MIVTTTTRKQFDTIEKESLEAHVEMCAHRYSALERQIVAVEQIVKDLDSRARDSRSLIIKTVGMATVVISTVISGIIFLIDRLN